MTASTAEPFLLGVNYWPRRKAMWMWDAFDREEVRDELALIADLGLRDVRVFLLWESFQPRPDAVDSSALGHLVELCDAAADLGLRVQATMFTGHMSGPNWAPSWLVDAARAPIPGERLVVGLARPRGYGAPIHDVYATPFVLDAEDLLLRDVARVLAGHPGLSAWSLGNEPDLFCRPRDAATGRRWVRDRVATIRSIDSDRPILIGLHDASLLADVGFRVDDVAAETDLSVMHGYSIYSPLARSPLDPDYVPFAAALATALAGRPILFEEFGANTRQPDGPSHWEDLRQPDGSVCRAYFASEDEAAAYVAAVLPRLVRVGALGAYLWCFADYDRTRWHLPPCDFQVHERFFGLVRPDGTLKPAAEVVRRFARSMPTVREPERSVTLPGTPDEYYADPAATMARLYETFGTLG